MPLMHSKSKKAFRHNVEAEMHAGKPQKQALAIAYSLKGESREPHHKPPHKGQEYRLRKEVE